MKVNGREVDSLWTVPFEARIGRNMLEIYVTIEANRIADYERRGVYWKEFYDINMVNMAYKPFDASSWKTVPSGLLGPVMLTPLREVNR